MQENCEENMSTIRYIIERPGFMFLTTRGGWWFRVALSSSSAPGFARRFSSRSEAKRALKRVQSWGCIGARITEAS
jgi:hypothetical protein